MKKIVKIILWSLFALLVVGVFYFLYAAYQPKKTRYSIVTVSQMDSLENKTVLTGKINPRTEVLLKPQVSGIIAEIKFKPGDKVSANDVVARIEVVPDMRESNNAETQVTLSSIALQQAKEKYERDKELYEKGVVSKEELENSTAHYLQAKENSQSSIEARDIVMTGRSSRTASSTTTLVRATTGGTILDIPVKVGTSVIQANTFNDGTTIAQVADMTDLLFEGKVDETIVGQLHVGQRIRLRIGALGERFFAAEIEYIAPKGTLEGNVTSYDVKAAVKLPKDVTVRAGYGANGDVILASAHNVLAIPENCVFYKGEQPYVKVVKGGDSEHPKIEERNVVLGISDGINVEVKQGLQKGEKIESSLIQK